MSQVWAAGPMQQAETAKGLQGICTLTIEHRFWSQCIEMVLGHSVGFRSQWFAIQLTCEQLFVAMMHLFIWCALNRGGWAGHRAAYFSWHHEAHGARPSCYTSRMAISIILQLQHPGSLSFAQQHLCCTAGSNHSKTRTHQHITTTQGTQSPCKNCTCRQRACWH